MATWTPAAVLQLIRQVRHDYLNHFQVISGYLELGMPERAVSYLKRVTEEADREREILSRPEAAVGLAFYQARLTVRGRGIILEPGTIEIEDLQLLDIFVARIDDIINNLTPGAAGDEDIVVEVSLRQTGESALEVTVTDGAGSRRVEVITRE